MNLSGLKGQFFRKSSIPSTKYMRNVMNLLRVEVSLAGFHCLLNFTRAKAAQPG